MDSSGLPIPLRLICLNCCRLLLATPAPGESLACSPRCAALLAEQVARIVALLLEVNRADAR
jgi:hypothetical protein